MVDKKFFDVVKTELIGSGDAVAASRWGKSVSLTMPVGDMDGEVMQVVVSTRTGGTGQILTPDGKLFFFDADPAISAGATGLTTGEHATIIGEFDIESADFYSDTKGAVAVNKNSIAFYPLKTLYVAWFQEASTGFNGATGDLEILEMRAVLTSHLN